MLCKKLKHYSVFMVPLSQKKKRMKTKTIHVQNKGKQANKENKAKNKNNKEILNPCKSKVQKPP